MESSGRPKRTRKTVTETEPTETRPRKKPSPAGAKSADPSTAKKTTKGKKKERETAPSLEGSASMPPPLPVHAKRMYEDSDDEPLPTVEEIMGTPSTVLSKKTEGKDDPSSTFDSPSSLPFGPDSDSDGEDLLAPKPGDAVLARYPSSTDKLYYPCRILRKEKDGRYAGEFWDGSKRTLVRKGFFMTLESGFVKCKLATLPPEFYTEHETSNAELSARLALFVPQLHAVLTADPKCKRMELFETDTRIAERKLREMATTGAFSSAQSDLLCALLAQGLPEPYSASSALNRDKLARFVLLPEFVKLDMRDLTPGMSDDEAEERMERGEVTSAVGTGAAWVERLLSMRTLYAEH